MKFITEAELRARHRQTPFTSYRLETGTRLTPEARQFLVDRKIPILCGAQQPKGQAAPCDWRSGKLLCLMQRGSASFLLIGQQLLQSDVLLAQRVFELGRHFRKLHEHCREAREARDLDCQECTGINATNFSQDNGDCFEVTEFHPGLEKGREIALLHYLRSTLREIEPAALEAFDAHPDGPEREQLIQGVNRIINTLSRMICQCTGGKTCQR